MAEKDTSTDFDLVVIGGGPSGYVAALRAAQLGLRIALVEREHLGGICLNWGCIPTKALLHASDTLRRIKQASELGISVGAPTIDLGAMISRSRGVANRLSRGVAGLLKKAKIDVLNGHASFTSGAQLQVTLPEGSTRMVKARHVIIATGARARGIPSLPFDGQHVWSYREALTPPSLPKSLLVVGAGAIGLEFASFYAELGTKVTVIEAQSRVLPGGDEDISAFVQRAMTHDGISVRTDCALIKADVLTHGVRATVRNVSGDEVIEVERILVAIGLVANTDKLGLEHTSVKLERGLISVDRWGATAQPGIHAIGDVVGMPMLAHKAMHEGILAVERIAGLRTDESAHSVAIPACTYGHPQTASVGLTEGEARKGGAIPRVGRFPLEGNGKAVAIGEAMGFVKTIFDADSGALLGAHIVGPEATELIHGFVLALGLETTEAELIETVFPHPTISEAMHESVLAAFGRALHA
ncbi:MAG: dihydrolipoyl dehydrogenase [Burkholderiaceae bacterium]|nr:dihydrolipoyl dehydrogenase [Burkholderiaceae bacterium]